jgi:hypothetical protein
MLVIPLTPFGKSNNNFGNAKGGAHQIYTDAWLKVKQRSIEFVFPVHPSSAGLPVLFPLETNTSLTKHFYQTRSDVDLSPLGSLGVSAGKELLEDSLLPINISILNKSKKKVTL